MLLFPQLGQQRQTAPLMPPTTPRFPGRRPKSLQEGFRRRTKPFRKSAVFSHALWEGFFAILGGFWCRNPPKKVPKLVRNRVLERTWCCITFLHDFCMFFTLFSINLLDVFLHGLLALFLDFLYFLKTAEVHFGVTSSRILRSCRVSARERFSKLFAKIRENRYDFYLQNL